MTSNHGWLFDDALETLDRLKRDSADIVRSVGTKLTQAEADLARVQAELDDMREQRNWLWNNAEPAQQVAFRQAAQGTDWTL